MLAKEKLARINELARKAKEGALTPKRQKNKRNYAKNIYRPSFFHAENFGKCDNRRSSWKGRHSRKIKQLRNRKNRIH